MPLSKKLINEIQEVIEEVAEGIELLETSEELTIEEKALLKETLRFDLLWVKDLVGNERKQTDTG